MTETSTGLRAYLDRHRFHATATVPRSVFALHGKQRSSRDTAPAVSEENVEKGRER